MGRDLSENGYQEEYIKYERPPKFTPIRNNLEQK
jgi:hypothetical protein